MFIELMNKVQQYSGKWITVPEHPLSLVYFIFFLFVY